MSVFFTDSNSELWYTVVDELGIKYISMPYMLDGKEYGYDLGKTYDADAFFSALRKGVKSSTMSLNPQQYIDIFEPVLKDGQDILYVTFSSGMSGTFEFMRQAIDTLKQKYPERTIRYVDTLNISMGAGLIAYEAAKLHNSGASDDEVIKFVEDFRNEVAVYFTANDLMYLKRGGRLSATTAIFGTVLGIKPVLSVSKQGKIVPVGKAMGRKKSLNYLLDRFKQEAENVADYPISILHADCEQDAKYLESNIRKIVGEDATIWVHPIGPTVSVHCGPDTVGIIFHKANK